MFATSQSGSGIVVAAPEPLSSIRFKCSPSASRNHAPKVAESGSVLATFLPLRRPLIRAGS